MNKKALLELLSFPAEKTLPGTDVEKLKAYEKDLNKILDQLASYKEKIREQLREKEVEPRLKEVAQVIFDAYPEVEFIAILERYCSDDDSGNCYYCTETTNNVFPDIDEDDDPSRWTKEVESAYEELCNLFTELYPDLNFDDEDNAAFCRPKAYYGIDREFDAARWEEE